MRRESYDVIIIGLNGVTAYSAVQVHSIADSILILTGLPEDKLDPYGVCMLDYVYLMALGVRRENLLLVRPRLLEVLPKIDFHYADIVETRVKREDNKIVVETQGGVFETRLLIMSYELRDEGNSIFNVELLEKLLNKHGGVALRGEDSFKLLEAYLNLREHGYSCTLSRQAYDTVSMLAQELHIAFPGGGDSVGLPEVTTTCSIAEPTKVQLGDSAGGVVDLRRGSERTDLTLLALLTSHLLGAKVLLPVRLRAVLSREHTCHVAGLTKSEAVRRVRDCSTTRSTLYLSNCTVVCKVVYRRNVVLGLSVTSQGSPDQRCIGDLLFLSLLGNIYGLNLMLPFLPSTLISEPRLNPLVTCIRNMMREHSLEKLFKPHVEHVV